MNELIPLMVIVPMMAALLLSAFSKFNKVIKVLAFVVAIILPIIPIASNYGLHFFGGYQPMVDNVTNIVYHPAITYSFTFMQQIFIAMIGILTFLVIFIYLTKYKKVSGSYLFLLFMGTASVTALILTDDIFHMFVFFEILALAQVGIVAASSIDYSTEMALKYMILGSIGSPMMLLGIGFLLAMTGTVNVTDIVSIIRSGLLDVTSPVFLTSLALIFFGWLYASGLPPFNVIKSLVYSKAEPYGSSVLQAMSLISLIAFIIAMFRIFGTLDIFKGAIIFISIASMILGVSMAAMQTDFRRMIAYLSVGELGFVGLGFGIGGNFAITAGLFQGLNEMIVTTLLFIGLGTVVYLTNTSDTRKLGGLIGKNTFMAIMILLGGLAMAGVPPFNGFRSKLMIVEAALNTGFPEIAVIIILISIATFFVFVKAFHSIFLKPQPRDLTFIRDSIPKSILFTVLVLLIICLILGLYPELVTNPISQSIGGLL